MSISTGDDAVLDDVFSYQIYNKIKNAWRGASAPADIQAGMIFSDSDDDRIYHYTGAALEEIIHTGATETVINEDGADLDFRVEGDTITNLFQVDAGNDEVIFGAFAGFAVEFDNGNSGNAKTIDWGKSNKQTIAMTDDCTFTFTAPGNKGNVLLKATTANSKVITFPGTVKWPGGTKPTASTGAADVDIYTFYFDGTNYYGNGSLDFS